MKKLTFLLPLFLLGMFSSCDIDTPEKAADYYDVIIKKTNKLITVYENELLESFSDFVPAEMEEKYNNLEKYVNETSKELEAIEPYCGDAKLIDDAKALLAAYTKALPLYKEKVELESVETIDYTNEIADQSVALSDEIDEMLNAANDKFRATTKEFGKEHKFKIKNM